MTSGNFVTALDRRRRSFVRDFARALRPPLAPQLLSLPPMHMPSSPRRLICYVNCVVALSILAGCAVPEGRVIRYERRDRYAYRPPAKAAATVDYGLGELPPATTTLTKASFFTAYVPRENEVPGVVGRLGRYKVAAGQNLLEIARQGGLGFRELRDANPKVDEWEPNAGVELVLPTRRILPRPNRYQGLVINIPEFRLYMFPTDTKLGDRAPVMTWPVGLGAEHAPSPVIQFRVKSKDEKPTWVVPDSILAKMEKPKRVVPPGPDNPLGDYRIRLDFDLYAIHGTNDAWSVGRLTTHGCVRLYPEDIEYLYPLVDRGFPGEFVYQPVKVGERKGRIFVEVHQDVYEMVPDMKAHAEGVLGTAGLLDRVDVNRVHLAATQMLGIPIDVTKGVATAAGDEDADDDPIGKQIAQE